MKLPKVFVEDNLEKAKGSMVFGIPIEELGRDELIACVAYACESEKRTREEGMRRINFMADMQSHNLSLLALK